MGNIATCMRSSSMEKGKFHSTTDTLEYPRDATLTTAQRKCSADNIASEGIQQHYSNAIISSTSIPTSSAKQTEKDASEQIFILCEKGTLQTIEFLIDNYPQVINHINDRYSCQVKGIIMQITPLQLAAACGHDDVVQYLLSLPNIEPNISDPMYLMTALHLAVFYNRMAAIEVLSKDLRVDLSERNVDGKTAIHLAIEKGSVAAVEGILRIRPMLDFKVKDFDGNTVLHTAALFPSERIFQLLIQYIENQKRMCVSNTTEEMFPSPFSMKKWKYLYDVTNFQGETALQVLKRNITVLEAKRTAWYDNHDHNDKETNESNEHDLRMSSPIASIRHSFDQKLLVMKACVQLVQDCVYKEVETMTSFGNHSPDHPLVVREDTISLKADSASNITTSDSTESRDTAAAYTWSPSQQGLKQSITKSLVMDSSLHD